MLGLSSFSSPVISLLASQNNKEPITISEINSSGSPVRIKLDRPTVDSRDATTTIVLIRTGTKKATYSMGDIIFLIICICYW